MIIVAILFSLVVIGGGTWPYIAAYGMLGVFIFFAFAVIAFLIAFAATPHRFGSLFAR